MMVKEKRIPKGQKKKRKGKKEKKSSKTEASVAANVGSGLAEGKQAAVVTELGAEETV